MRTFLSFFLSLNLLLFSSLASPVLSAAPTPPPEKEESPLSASITAPGAVLMEASTGTVIFE